MADVTVRVATGDDAVALGEVAVRAWQAAYVDDMPGDYLAALDPAARAAGFRRGLDDPGRAAEFFVAELDGAVVGFAIIGPERIEQQCGSLEGTGVGVGGELFALNVDPDAWSCGAGSALLGQAHDRLAGRFADAVLWVVTGNARARRFYEHHGWEPDGVTQIAPFTGPSGPFEVAETRYFRRLP